MKFSRNIASLVTAAALIAVAVGGVNWAAAGSTLEEWEKIEGHKDAVGALAFVASYCNPSMPWAADIAFFRYEHKYPEAYRNAYRKMRDDMTGTALTAGLASALMCPVVQNMVNAKTSWKSLTVR
jgi:hypothetical protein